MRRLPSLNALRALEAAGRYGNFTLAAKELNVTPGAVSRQIKLLEETLGQDLFIRENGTLGPTERCQEYTYVLSDVFSRIETATQKLQDVESELEICLSASMTFTLHWMVPRMTSFHDQYPKWRLRLSAALPPPRLNDGGATDFFVQLGDGNETDFPFEKLISNDLVPVCSPEFLEKGPALRVPEDLRHHTRLHSILRPTHWGDWLTGAGVEGVDATDGNTHGTSALCYQAAIEGLGIAMGQAAFVIDDLEAGRLVTPFPLIVEGNEAFNLIPGPKPLTQKLEDFFTWIKREAAEHEARVNAFTAQYERRRVY